MIRIATMRDGPIKVSLVSFSVLDPAAVVATALFVKRASVHQDREIHGELCIDSGGLRNPFNGDSSDRSLVGRVSDARELTFGALSRVGAAPSGRVGDSCAKRSERWRHRWLSRL